MKNQDLYKLQTQVREAFSGKTSSFRPCAFFDDRLDCIRVIARDCSVLEERVNDRLTVLIDNYAEQQEKKYVGFTLKGARHFCEKYGLGRTTSIKMSELLDAILRSSPEIAVEWFINFVARPLVEREGIDHVAMEPLPEPI